MAETTAEKNSDDWTSPPPHFPGGWGGVRLRKGFAPGRYQEPSIVTPPPPPDMGHPCGAVVYYSRRTKRRGCLPGASGDVSAPDIGRNRCFDDSMNRPLLLPLGMGRGAVHGAHTYHTLPHTQKEWHVSSSGPVCFLCCLIPVER